MRHAPATHSGHDYLQTKEDKLKKSGQEKAVYIKSIVGRVRKAGADRVQVLTYTAFARLGTASSRGETRIYVPGCIQSMHAYQYEHQLPIYGVLARTIKTATLT